MYVAAGCWAARSTDSHVQDPEGRRSPENRRQRCREIWLQ